MEFGVRSFTFNKGKLDNLPNKGTDMEVGGIISANSKKNTVNESRIEMDKDTWVTKETVH